MRCNLARREPRGEQPAALQPTKQNEKGHKKMCPFSFCSGGRTRTGDPLITRSPIVSNRRGLSLHHAREGCRWRALVGEYSFVTP